MRFKYRLKSMNVIKVTNEEDMRDRLIAQGFRLIENKEEIDKEYLNKLTVEKLREIAKEKGLEGYSKLSKEDLIKLLKES